MIFKEVRLAEGLADRGGVWDVEIRGDRIFRIGRFPEEGILCRGMTLLPGLIDAHTHITGLRDYGVTPETDPEGYRRAAVAHTRKYLEHGFTTIRDCGCSREAMDGVQKSKELLPDVVWSRRIVAPSALDDGTLTAMYHFADNPEEFYGASRSELEEGAAFVKIMASGSAFQKSSSPDEEITTEQEILAAVRAAKESGAYVAAHAHPDCQIRLCIAAGVRTIEHATYLSDETMEMLLAKTRDGEEVYLIPTLAAMYNSMGAMDPYYEELLGGMLERCCAWMRKAYRRGLPLGFGTDSTVTMPQYDAGIEFRYRFERCKMDPVGILKQATALNAAILGLTDRGYVAENRLADLILVRGNPDQDISLMYQKPELVIKSGQIAWKKGGNFK